MPIYSHLCTHRIHYTPVRTPTLNGDAVALGAIRSDETTRRLVRSDAR